MKPADCGLCMFSAAPTSPSESCYRPLPSTWLLILRSLMKAGSPRSLADLKIAFFAFFEDWWPSSCRSLPATAGHLSPISRYDNVTVSRCVISRFRSARCHKWGSDTGCYRSTTTTRARKIPPYPFHPNWHILIASIPGRSSPFRSSRTGASDVVIR